MKLDKDEFDKLTDEEKADYLRRLTDTAREEAKGRTLPPGAIGLEKSYAEEATEVVGQMMPDGTIHYYTEDEQRALNEQAKREIEAEKRAKAESARPDAEDEGNPPG